MRSVPPRLIWLAFLMCALSAVSHASVQQRDILPTTQVSPVRFGLGSTTLPIDVRWPVACPCTLSVTNGAPNSTLPPASGRVFAGWIWVDNVLVLTPIQLSIARASASAVLALPAGPHQIRLQLIGLPTSYVRVRLSGSVSVADLAAPRAGHSANLLPDGSVFVAGGESALGVLDSTELIAGDASSTVASDPLTQARAGHAATLVAGGATTLTGGRDAFGDLSGVEVRTAAGSVAGNSLDEGRRDHTATTLLDGRVLVLGGTMAGGAATNSGLIIDPRPDPFTEGQYDPVAAAVTALGPVLQTARLGHTATLLDDGTVLVIGGRNGSADLRSMELFDPDAGTSMALPALLATGRSNHTATLRANGSIVVAGGRNGASLLSSIEIVGATLSGVTAGGSLAIARAGHSATMIRGGEILIAGGWTAAGVTANTELAPPPPADSLTPSIVAIAPADDAVDVDRAIVIALQASEPLDPATVSADHIALQNGGGAAIPAAIGIADHGTLITVRPDALLPGDTYTVTVTGVADRTGLVLPPFSFSFTTIATPVITTIAPTEGPAGTEVTVSGSGFGATAADNQLSFGATLVPVVPVSATSLTFTASGTAPGTYPVSLRTRGGLAIAATPFQLRNPVPTLTEIAPSLVLAGSPAFTLSLTGTNFINSASVVVGATTLPATFLSATSLQAEVPAASIAAAGALDVHVANPAPGGGASNHLSLVVEPSGPPVSTLTIFPRGMNLTAGGGQHFTVEARYADGSVANVTAIAAWTSSNTAVIIVAPGGSASAVSAGTASISASLGGQTATAAVTVYAGEAIPPDPVHVAPELKSTVSTPLSESTRFLYEGENPIQRDVVSGAIDERRVAVVKGIVTTRDGQPVSGVRVAIAERAELGHTLTRADGAYDLAVNGGGDLVIEYAKSGILPAERRITVPSADFSIVPDVVVVALDPQVTTVDLTAAVAMQVAEGSPSTDSSGTRKATVFFPQGTAATMVLPDGSTQPLTTLHVRATEYTVGPNGPAAMPGSLPPASAYTYAVELSVDEAIAAGATSVQLSAPVPIYVENFLGFPIGAIVPTGYYDRTLGAWVASTDGVVIKILSIDGDGRAQIDLNGDAAADDLATLAELGITDAERLTLGAKYAAEQSLWRVPVKHFTPWDHNWPQIPPLDADQKPTLEPPGTGDAKSKSKCETGGSIIECQDQVLGERLPIAGTPFTLNYRSDRVPGRLANRLSIPLTEATVPASLQRIDLTVTIAGRKHSQSFSPLAGQVAEFTWDGLDAYGRVAEGPQRAEVAISHVYNMFYVSRLYLRALNAAAFGLPNVGIPEPEMYPVPGREFGTVPVRWSETLSVPPRALAPLAGWTIDVNHSYQSVGQTVLFGDGRRRTEAPAGVTPIDLPASVEFYDNKVAAEGAVYYVDAAPEGGSAIYRKAPSSEPTEVGAVPYAVHFAVDREGVIYYPDCEGSYSEPPLENEQVSIYRMVPGGAASRMGSAPIPAGEQCELLHIARASDGTLFVDIGTEVFQMVPGGSLSPIGGEHEASSMAIGPDGSVYRAVAIPPGMIPGVERLDPSGVVTLIGGGKQNGTVLGGGGPALDAIFGSMLDIAVTNDGSVLVASLFGGVYRLQQITPAGRLYTIAGGVAVVTVGFLTGPSPSLLPEGTSPLSIRDIEQVEVGPDGWIYVFGLYAYRFRPLLADSDVRIASDDGSEFYEFNSRGQHLRTVHALTGATRYTFTYDAGGRLTTITDGDGLVTAIDRDSAGAPTAIVAPFGQTTLVSQDGNGWLTRIVAPGDRTTELTSTESGLLTGMVDANGQPYTFTYNDAGRLIRDDGPAGGSETLVRTELPGGGWSTTLTSGLGRTRTYRTDIVVATGAQQLTVTEADGTIGRLTTSPDGTRDSLSADGTRTVVTMAPDPRFGLQAPVPKSLTIRTPAGRQLTRTAKREVSQLDLLDPATLVQTDTVTLNGRIAKTVFTGATRTLTSTSAAGRISITILDAQGRVTRTQIGTLTPVDFTYDAQGRLTHTTQGTRVSAIAYDGSGRPATLTDALTRTVQFGYDAADRVTTQTLPDTRTIGFAYDANSNVTAVTPPERPVHAFTFTPVNLTASYEPPTVAGTGNTGYLFNIDREPTAIQRPDGQTTAFGYDAGGRLSTVTFSRGTLTFGYDAAGRVSSLADPGGVNLAFTYDGALPLRELWSGAVTGNVTRTFSNDLDLLTETVTGTASTPAIAFGYDTDRLLTSAGALTIARDAATGLVNSTTLAITTDAHQYNTFGELARQTARAGGTQVFDVQIARDDLGRITQRIEAVDGITRVFQYGYDLAGRLETVTRNGDVVVHYTYDGNGNRLSAEGEAGLVAGTYDDQDRLLTYGGATYTYTANGELATKTVAGQSTSYVYDTLGNLIRVTKPNGQVITYTIDGRGRRVGKSINGARVKGWLYADQLRPIAELTGTGAVLSRFVYGTKANVPEYMIRSGVTYRIVSDHLGTPRVVVHATTGAIAQRLDVQPFGEIIQDSNPGWQPFGFAGGLYDPDTGLIRFGARDYDPQAGRWTAKDPIGFDSNEVNHFAYVLNNPVESIDPIGLLTVPGLGWIDVGENAGQQALEHYAGMLDDTSLSAAQRGAAWAGAFFAALWTPCSSNATAATLAGGYMSRVLGPFPKAGVPRQLNRIREFLRFDPPHHGKGWEFDGRIPKAIRAGLDRTTRWLNR